MSKWRGFGGVVGLDGGRVGFGVTVLKVAMGVEAVMFGFSGVCNVIAA